MVIMLSTADGEARTLFSERDIGDTDGDGAPEFLDGWGRPITWLRWPVGFVSDLMPIDPLTNQRYYNEDHDPFDPFRLQNLAFRISPLIFSPGLDGILDISSFTESITGNNPYKEILDNNGDPILGSNGEFLYLGTQRDGNDDGEDNSLDNIHNHLLDGK